MDFAKSSLGPRAAFGFEIGRVGLPPVGIPSSGFIFPLIPGKLTWTAKPLSKPFSNEITVFPRIIEQPRVPKMSSFSTKQPFEAVL